jgi:predicted permease
MLSPRLRAVTTMSLLPASSAFATLLSALSAAWAETLVTSSALATATSEALVAERKECLEIMTDALIG